MDKIEDKYSPEKALQCAQSIAFPRAVGTQGETIARARVTSLFKDMGLRVQRHHFAFSSTAEIFLKIEILTYQLLILVAVGLQILNPALAFVPAILLVLIIVLSGAINRSVQVHSLAPGPGESPSLWTRLIHALGKHYTTANILAEFPNGVDDPYVPHLILAAHIDTKSQRISLAARITLFTICISGGMLIAILNLLSSFTPAFTNISTFIAVIVLFASLPLLFLDYGNASSGAIDNASGVGLLLHLAEVLAAEPQLSDRLRVTFLISSAEELATMGSRAYVKQYAAKLGEQAKLGGLHVLNFDGIGIKGDLYLVSPDRSASRKKSPLLRVVIRDAFADTGIKLRRFVLPGALFDHMPFSDAGIDAATLVAIGVDSRWVHSPSDTADKLDTYGFDQAGRVALKVISGIAEMRRHPYGNAV